jgi:cytochrome c oxidase cbb3-type subunit III
MRGGRIVGEVLLGAVVMVFTGCMKHVEEYTRPDEIIDFQTLYAQNCAGCHGPDGRNGAAQPLNDPVYQHLVTKDQLRKIIAEGRRGTSMTGWSKSAGGILTDQQIDILVNTMQSKWRGDTDFHGMPSFEAASQGDARRGEAAYQTFCQGCHGPEGKGGPKAGSIVNSSFLALATNQSLRTTTIVGRPDLQIPDWRGYVPNHPMTDAEISDVVAWLASQRPGTALVSQAQPPKENQ